MATTGSRSKGPHSEPPGSILGLGTPDLVLPRVLTSSHQMGVAGATGAVGWLSHCVPVMLKLS